MHQLLDTFKSILGLQSGPFRPALYALVVLLVGVVAMFSVQATTTIEEVEIVIAEIEAPVAPLPMSKVDLEDEPLPLELLPGRRVDAGPASFYGAAFAGRLTANGERFSPDEMTAAHRTLPFGSKVRVTNTRNGRSVIVRINDRGPFHGNRVIDLSTAAARELGFIRSGTAPVEIDLLPVRG